MTVLLTVFTPTYNRAHTLIRTYESLQRQSSKNFKWLIIDDGSTDETSKLVSSWQQSEDHFEILYHFKENGGMHTGHNMAYTLIDTELNVCIDSDDELAEDACRLIEEKWKEIKHGNYAGIIGLDADLNGDIIGSGFPEKMHSTTLHGYYANGGRGDKKLVFRTKVIRSVPPYPEFEGEKLVPLSYKYLLIDQSYQLSVLNKVLCNVEYQEDGSTNSRFKNYAINPRGFAFLRKHRMIYPTSSRQLVTDIINYSSCCFLSGNLSELFKAPRVLSILALSPVGFILSRYIRMKSRKA